jgi:hypothetical protein
MLQVSIEQLGKRKSADGKETDGLVAQLADGPMKFRTWKEFRAAIKGQEDSGSLKNGYVETAK